MGPVDPGEGRGVMTEVPAAGMIVRGQIIDLEEHLRRALQEQAEAMGKEVSDLTGPERQQAFCSYIMAGKHMGAEEAVEDETG